jgi:hypothetical protein
VAWDFSLEQYREILGALKSRYEQSTPFCELMGPKSRPQLFCAIRHDVDRRPQNALKLAQLESEAGLKATYYFRTRPGILDQQIVQQIKELGHEIGYHYECLSDSHGDFDAAYKLFANDLAKLRTLASIHTIAMHGSPFSPFDNRDLWSGQDGLKILSDQHQIFGEVYLHFDYQNVAYLTDTGRSWNQGASNLRDHVNSNLKVSFDSGAELITWLAKTPSLPNFVFSTHPERWERQASPRYFIQWAQDKVINTLKRIVRLLRPRPKVDSKNLSA